MKSYVSYRDQDDMQDDTYKILSELIIDAIYALRGKDIRTLHSDIDSMYIMVWSRMSREQQGEFERRLEDAAGEIYSPDVGNDPLANSNTFDTLRLLLKDLTRVIDEMGILFRMRTDIDKLVTRGKQ